MKSSCKTPTGAYQPHTKSTHKELVASEPTRSRLIDSKLDHGICDDRQSGRRLIESRSSS